MATIDDQGDRESGLFREVFGVDQPIERGGREQDLRAGSIPVILNGESRSKVLGSEKGSEESVSGLASHFAGRHIEVGPDKRIQPKRRVLITWTGNFRRNSGNLRHCNFLLSMRWV